MTVKNRLSRLEISIGTTEPLVIVTQHVNPDGTTEPVDGLKSEDGQHIVHRLPGESDDAMIARVRPNRKEYAVILLPFNNRE